MAEPKTCPDLVTEILEELIESRDNIDSIFFVINYKDNPKVPYIAQWTSVIDLAFFKALIENSLIEKIINQAWRDYENQGQRT